MATQFEMPAAAPVPPLGLAGYQEGAVVSRTLLERDGAWVWMIAPLAVGVRLMSTRDL